LEVVSCSVKRDESELMKKRNEIRRGVLIVDKRATIGR
jgi:hypothetical protein